MIQLVSDIKSYKDVLKNMWKLCFPLDSEMFVDFYFDKVCSKNETLIFLKKEKPVASVQMLPYLLKIGSKICRGGYISGLMTLPEYRGKGYMSQLLNHSFNIMRKKGYKYTFLIPQKKGLVRVYEKFGYRMIQNPPFYCPEFESDSYQTDFSFRIYSSFHLVEKKCYSIYFQFLNQQPCTVLKTPNRFQQVLWTFFHENGNLFVNEDSIAFTFKRDRKILIKEFFYKNQDIKKKCYGLFVNIMDKILLFFLYPIRS